MFTGIITDKGKVKRLEALGGEQAKSLPYSPVRIHVAHHYDDDPITAGESIAMNGVCLTVTPTHPQEIYCDVSTETLSCTHLNTIQIGDILNLERSLRLSDRLGGHFVSGHVDQTARVQSIKVADGFAELLIDGIHKDNQIYLYPKGSITLNGVSLTVNATVENGVSLMLIPETRLRTNLGHLKVNDIVNIEFDMLAKWAAHQWACHPGIQTLKQR